MGNIGIPKNFGDMTVVGRAIDASQGAGAAVDLSIARTPQLTLELGAA